MKKNVTVCRVGGARNVDGPNSQSSTKSLPYLTMKEFASESDNLSCLSDENKGYIKKTVKDFFGVSEFVYRCESDEGVAAMLGFIPVQRFNQEDIVGMIESAASMGIFGVPMPFYGFFPSPDVDFAGNIDFFIHGVLNGLEYNPPQDCV